MRKTTIAIAIALAALAAAACNTPGDSLETIEPLQSISLESMEPLESPSGSLESPASS